MVAVVIPIYKNFFSKEEEISLNQIKCVLGHRDLFFLMPGNLQLKSSETGIHEVRFPDEFFESIESYNKMMLSTKVYQYFKDYQYLLICQLDAYIFEDKLDYLCTLDYDYIGAPWLEGVKVNTGNDQKICFVGNGGLSLRRIATVISLLENHQDTVSTWVQNEDLFFASMDSPSFKVAPINIALQFAFEGNIVECFRLVKGELPMGCHAWGKYDTKTLLPYINLFGIDNEEIQIGNLDKTNKELVFWDAMAHKGPLFESYRKNIENFLNKYEKIAVWGTGYFGRKVKTGLGNADIIVNAFIESDKDKVGNTICGIPVIDVSEDILKKYYVIIAVYKRENEIIQKIQELVSENECSFISFDRLAYEVWRKGKE